MNFHFTNNLLLQTDVFRFPEADAKCDTIINEKIAIRMINSADTKCDTMIRENYDLTRSASNASRKLNFRARVLVSAPRVCPSSSFICSALILQELDPGRRPENLTIPW